MEPSESASPKPKRGRPKKPIDLPMVEKLAHIQCTHVEIASALGVSVDTLTRHKEFAEVYKRGAEGGRKSLRRMQFESANKGNVAMQIWLGKQYLGQSDHAVSEVRSVQLGGQMSPAEVSRVVDAYLERHPSIRAEVAALDANADLAENGPKPLPLPRLLTGPRQD